MRLRFWSVVVMLVLAPAILFAQEGEVPDLPLTNDFLYTVEAGDTIESVAALFDVQVDCLLETNELGASDTVIAGDLLLISIDCPAYDGLLDVRFPRPDAPTDEVTTEETTPLGETTDEVEEVEDVEEVQQTVVPGGTYTIQRGDTLDTIGQEFDISVQQLRQFNDLERTAILQIGDVLNIPADPLPYGVVPPSPSEASEVGGGAGGGVAGELYVIQPGDTLDVIAQEFNVSLVQLEIVNDLENQRIFPGQQIVIPEDAVPYGEFPPIADEDAGEVGGGVAGELYVVQPGDTLDVIAQEFNVSLVQLEIVNGLEDQRIFPGQQIVIPEDAVPYGQFPPIADEDAGEIGGGVAGELYVVQPGDTLDVIAQEFNVSLVQLEQINGLEDQRIFPGQQIVIPEDAVPYGEFPPIADEDAGEVGGGVAGELYVIQPGDTLDVIAQEFNVSLVQLEQVNGLEDERIFPGQQIVIPEDAVPYGQFPPLTTGDGQGGGISGIDSVVLQVGGTLDEIAQEFDVSTTCLIEGNNITNTRNIQPGTEIIIPTGCPPYQTGVNTDDSDDDTLPSDEPTG